MKRITLLICIYFSALQLCLSQVSEIGLCVGGSFYIGELNPSGMFAKLQPAGGAMYRYNFSPRWAFKSTVMFGSMEASDAETNGGDPRGLSFRSPRMAGSEPDRVRQLCCALLQRDRRLRQHVPHHP